ncbi:MAG: hypothetical protein HY381_00625 [Candidatus Chisholmbacteria bacterium]|nr:hypothetical protein [Candidatus Chisholmbacteria bacterium]
MSPDQAPETRENYLHNLAQQLHAIDLSSLQRDPYGWPDFAANEPNLPAVQAFHELPDAEADTVLGLVFPEEKPGQDVLYSTPQQLLDRIDRGLVLIPESSGNLALPQSWIDQGFNGEITVTVDQQTSTVTFEAVLPQEAQELVHTIDLSETQGLRQAMNQGHEAFWQFMKARFPQWNWPVGPPPRPLLPPNQS